MTTSWGWIGPYLIVIILAILVGPFLATLPLFTQTFVPPLGMNAAQAVRFLADGLCLLVFPSPMKKFGHWPARNPSDVLTSLVY